MKTIWKYDLFQVDSQQFSCHLPATVLSAGQQSGFLYAWVLVDTNMTSVVRKINVRGTGHVLTGNEGQFVDTVQMNNGLVWHVFVENG